MCIRDSLIFDQGAAAGVDISGGGPASRETPLASPVTADNPLNAIVLSGGSAFGLAAGDGVMRYLEEHGMGYPTGFANVPLVCQSCIYDLGMGRADIRPDAAMGYEACVQAEDWIKNVSSLQETFSCAADFNKSLCGSIGAGCGASVGKICGMERSMTVSYTHLYVYKRQQYHHTFLTRKLICVKSFSQTKFLFTVMHLQD